MELKKYGLIGLDIENSLSPLIYKESAYILGISLTYDLYSCRDDKAFLKMVSQIRREGLHGFNITRPFKILCAKLFEAEISSINCVDLSSTPARCASTDGFGFLRSLDSMDWGEFDRWIFLGSGGAVQGVVTTLMEKRPDLCRKIEILSRSGKKITPLVSHFKLNELDSLIRDGRCLVINGLSKGVFERDYLSEDFLEGLAKYKGAFFDMNYYSNGGLSYLDVFMNAGIPAVSGFSMLVDQALECQQFWWGVSADRDLLMKRLKSRLVPYQPVAG